MTVALASFAEDPVAAWSRWTRINLARASAEMLGGKPVPHGLLKEVAEVAGAAVHPAIGASLVRFGGGDA